MSEMRVRGLHKAFGKTQVLTGLDLFVAERSLTAVLGPSGCGKTTLLRLIAGFGAPDAGEIWIGGTRVSWAGGGLAPERRSVGIVPQEGALFPHLSVERNVAFGLRGAQWPRNSRGARVGELLELVGLAGYGRRMPHELSGGQQQRVAVARALAPGPALVLLDEPFSALDSGLRGSVRDDVRAALRLAGATAVLVTHDQQEALSMADSVAVVREGRVAQAAAPDVVYAAPHDAGVAAFVGAAVLLPAKIVDGRADCALGLLEVHAPDPSRLPAGAGTVLIRPEQLSLGSIYEGAAGRIEGRAYHGHEAMVTVSLAGGVTITARVLGSNRAESGTDVGVQVVGPVWFYPET
ncbi:MAG: ABC transporter ATP-binding protein [Sporichthyaceae bacterium]